MVSDRRASHPNLADGLIVNRSQGFRVDDADLGPIQRHATADDLHRLRIGQGFDWQRVMFGAMQCTGAKLHRGRFVFERFAGDRQGRFGHAISGCECGRSKPASGKAS